VRRLAALVLVACVLVACGDDDDDPTATTTTTSRIVEGGTSATVDWTARTSTIEGDTGFDVAFCDGDAPLLCVERDGEALGVIELNEYPDGAVADFDAWAEDFYDSMRADRIEGCDPDYVLTGDAPEPARLSTLDGVRYGFTGTVAGTVVERVLGYAANDGTTLRVLVANALGEESCLAREGELPIEIMDDLAPVLDAIARGSRF
jgi:hypothetical protein